MYILDVLLLVKKQIDTNAFKIKAVNERTFDIVANIKNDSSCNVYYRVVVYSNNKVKCIKEKLIPKSKIEYN